VWLCYLDESGNTGRRLDDPDQPVHLIAAVMVPEERVADMARSMDVLAAQWLPPELRRAEFHGAALYSGNGPWKGVAPGDRIQVYRSVLQLISELEAVVAHASVDKPRLAAKYRYPDSPHLLALQFLVEKIDTYLATQSDPLRSRGLLIADQTHEHEAFAIDLVAQMQRHGATIGTGRRLTGVIDSVHFVRSETNPGVQLADLVAFALCRLSKAKQPLRPGDQALQAALEEFVLPHVRTYRQRWP
jgi:hypothetical protein